MKIPALALLCISKDGVRFLNKLVSLKKAVGIIGTTCEGKETTGVPGKHAEDAKTIAEKLMPSS